LRVNYNQINSLKEKPVELQIFCLHKLHVG
jgi:hypothetical protein